MAFEFYYTVSLTIVHPSIDPSVISEKISALRPKKASKAGSIRCNALGEPIQPERKSLLTHWTAPLHDEPRLHSANHPFPAFLSAKLTDLEQFREVFLELGKEGDVFFRIGWFSITSHSAESLAPGLLQKAGNVGIGFELNYYAPDNPVAEEDPATCDSRSGA